MIVRELLLNALANAGHIHDGKSAEADELDLALRMFNSEMRRLSNRNLVTAYQKVIDIDEAVEETVIGSFKVARGKKLSYFSGSLPNANSYSRLKDYACLDNESYYECFGVTETSNAWRPCGMGQFCEYYPDLVVEDMERIVSVMYKNSAGKWNELRFVPLSIFYTENDDLIYCTSVAGENRVKMILPKSLEGKPVKIVYNTAMIFGKNDTIELPDAHVALVEIAVTTALLRKDADSDPTRYNNYREQLDELTRDIMANTSTERRIVRRSDSFDTDRLRSGSFIFR